MTSCIHVRTCIFVYVHTNVYVSKKIPWLRSYQVTQFYAYTITQTLNVCYALWVCELCGCGCSLKSWWRHQIMETFPALLALCAGNSQRPVPRSVDVFFYLRLNNRWSKQSWGFERLYWLFPRLYRSAISVLSLMMIECYFIAPHPCQPDLNG